MRIARKIVIGWEFYRDWALRGGVLGDNTNGMGFIAILGILVCFDTHR